ncbi:hypothetical protein LIQ52_03810 [Mitsuokella jalaludinii]|uniref:hypothetical protein n=1 Tax=Mitsuokella jalaludinii TaxID=187979 RepID=UPI001D01893C|nr:hypothetical protein [Mitsuokella jalaludinii]MCB5724454.1 hypothetical protein [Mitsuokella jalaludinii]
MMDLDGQLKMVKPIPCIYVKEKTIRDWFAKLDSEVNEFKEAVLQGYHSLNRQADAGMIQGLSITNQPIDKISLSDFVQAARDFDRQKAYEQAQKWRIAEERADVVTVLTSMMRALNIDDKTVQEAQECVNQSNHRKGRW